MIAAHFPRRLTRPTVFPLSTAFRIFSRHCRGTHSSPLPHAAARAKAPAPGRKPRQALRAIAQTVADALGTQTAHASSHGYGVGCRTRSGGGR